MPISARTTAIAAAVVIAAGLAVAYFVTRPGEEDRFAQCRRGVVAGGGGSIGGPFTLIDETGATVTDKDVITTPALIYFGYTYCPDVCPLDNARNAEAVMLLEDKGYFVTPIFISVDPARDTPEVLADFTSVMHPRMIGLTGTPEQVKAASQAYRTYFNIKDPSDPYYLVDHSTQTYLVFPKSGFAEFFNRDTTPQEMADRVSCFIDAENG
ncbi:SCO family protein [Phaeovulum sp.]|uniref:SCO family protein n=1 Tax=Phaeovulum sp. TaxID=2934796 RepID=UPI0039E6EF2E